jgi:hypothetical protein
MKTPFGEGRGASGVVQSGLFGLSHKLQRFAVQ